MVERFEDVLLVVPMHKNETVRNTLRSSLEGHSRISLIEPPDYPDFVSLMKRADLILTDSGGVQEEAPAFGKPVLVLRKTTERPEGVEAGTAKLIGTEKSRVCDEICILLQNRAEYDTMSKAVSPYGDGNASKRIRYILCRDLGVETPEEPMWT